MPTPSAMVVAHAATALAPTDQLLLDGAVAYLNGAMRESGVKLATTVSDYVVLAFFGGDATKLSQRGRAKASGYAALCEREDLEMGAATLQRLVRIGLQVKALPPELGTALTPGQHRALLVVAEPEHKVELAKAALAEHWTAERLEEVIAAEKVEGAKRGGRPAVPAVIKAISALRKAVAAFGPEDAIATAFGGLDAKSRNEAMTELNELASGIAGLAQKASGA